MTLPTSTAGGKKTPATDASVHKAYADKHHRVSWSPWWYLLLESVWLFLRDLFARVLLPSPHRTAPKLYPLDPIILTSATDLAAMIRAGKVTSRKATEVYIERCKAINPFLNTVVADRFEEALKEADKADALIKQKSPLVDRMPFLGVPCTIKESFALQGMPNTAGLPSRLPQYAIAKEDAVAVARMRAAGLIPIGVTNISELCMWYESNNKVYGRTCNPYDLRRIVGGSSGGEGAAVGSAISVLGLGADIGGSIRMPAFFNGVFGHKPSPAVVPNEGQHPMAQNEAARYNATGPICRYATDIWPTLQILKEPHIDLGHPKDVDLSKLRVLSIAGHPGVLIGQSVTPEIEDAQTKVLHHLVEVVGMKQIAPSKQLLEGLTQAFDVWSAMLNAAADTPFTDLLIGRKVDFFKDFGALLTGKSSHTLPALGLAWIEKFPEIIAPARFQASIKKGLEMRKEIQELLGEDGILLYPTHPTPAVLHNAPLLVPLNFQYTGILNVLELTATAIPMGLSKAEGVPLGIQVAAGDRNDKLTVAVAIELEKAFGGWVPPTAV